MEGAARDLLTRAELAHYLKVSLRQVDKLRKDDAFPRPIMLGGSPRWRKHLIDSYLGQLEPVSDGAAR